MKPVIRHTIFFLFLAFFFVSAPLIVLYTAGYRYNVFNGQFVRTGVLSVTTNPRNADISLNKKSIRRSSPHVIKYLIPRSYLLTLTKDGYHTWEAEVEIKSGETTLVQQLLLFRDDEAVLLFERETKIVTLSPDGKRLAYLIGEGGWEEIWLYQIQDDEHKMIGRFISRADEPVIELSWSTDGGYLLAQNAARPLVALYDQNGSVLEIEPDLLKGWNKVFWHPSSDHLLYLATAKKIQQYDLRDQSIMVFDDPNAATVVLDASILTFVDNGTQIELQQFVGEERELIALLPRASYTIEERDGAYLIITDNEGSLFLLNIHADQPILLQAEARIFDWLDGKQQLAYSDGYEVNVYDPLTHFTDFITRQGEEIKSLQWHPSGQNILMATENSLTAIERYQIGNQRQRIILLQDVELNSFWINPDGQTAYIFGTIDGKTGLFALRLMR